VSAEGKIMRCFCEKAFICVHLSRCLELKRITKKQRKRRRVIRNWICLVLVVAAIVVLTVVIVSAFKGNDNEDPDTPTRTTQSASVTTDGHQEVITQPSEGDSQDPTETVPQEPQVQDTQAPRLTGSEYIYVSVGSTVKYKSYVYAEDDIDPEPKLSIDNSAVDLSKPGNYPVVYTATDASGNSASKTCTIVVAEQSEPDVDEATIYALADQVLDSIIDEGMSDLDKVFAVFFYVRDTFTYVKDNNYWEYKQEAYHMMTTLQDNCYANVCVSKLLLERLGFESYMVEGHMGYVDEYHYWNMVSIDGGNTWYHYDAAFWEWMDDEYPMCMMTDAFATRISEAHDNIVDYAGSADVATPTEDLWTPEERGYYSYYLD